MDAPCDWDIEVDHCDAFDGLSNADQAEVIAAATDFLWNWTGRMFGVCSVAVRPCRTGCTGASTFWGNSPWSGGKMLPVLIGGSWFNMACGTCGTDDCSCSAFSSLRLPGPIAEITEVRLGGDVLLPENYRVDNNHFLVRTDGWAWPACQDMTMDPTTDPDTFLITYTRGIPVPAGGKMAASKLACEFAKWKVRPASCDLPARIKNITREGVQVTLMDDMKDLEGGKTGIWIIDSWVASVTQPRLPSTVRSVDIPHPKFRTTT